MPAPFSSVCGHIEQAPSIQVNHLRRPFREAKAMGASDGVLVQIQQLESRISQQLQEAMNRVELLVQSQQVHHTNLHQELKQTITAGTYSPQDDEFGESPLTKLATVGKSRDVAFVEVVSPAKGNEIALDVALVEGTSPSKNQSKSNGAEEKAAPNATEVEGPPPTGIRHIIYSKRFETFSVVVIIVNGLFIGYQADYAVKNPRLDTPTSTKAIEYLFFGWFWLELFAKMLAGPHYFIYGPEKSWNIFDTVLMVAGTIQNVVGASGAGASTLRCLRAGRVVRLAPFIKTNPFFKELRLMLYGTFACFRGLLFASLMLISIMYLFGMVFLGAATGYLKDYDIGDKYSTSYQLNLWYGSLFLAIRTLFRVISGGADWYDASAALWNVNLFYGLLFTAYIFLMVFGVLNVLVGVFVDSAMATASMDADILAREAEEERQAIMDQATTTLKAVDKDGSGTVTWPEFAENLADEAVISFLTAMQIDVSEAQGVFEMVDNDGSGYVNIDEFMECCMKLKMGANLNTIVTLLYELKSMHTKHARTLEKLHELGQKQHSIMNQVHEMHMVQHSVMTDHFNRLKRQQS